MAGTFRPGDCLTVAPASPREVRPGDVVVYRGPNRYGKVDELVHRVIAITVDGLVVRGDANPRPGTTLVTAGNLLGLVSYVERAGRRWRVCGGQRGLWLVQWRCARRRTARLLWCAGRRPYRWLRRSGLVARWWRPPVTKVRLRTEHGLLVKYVCGGRTVARWWPQQNYFECRKPFDLVLRRERERAFE